MQSLYLKKNQKPSYELPYTRDALEIVVKYLYYKLRWSVAVTYGMAQEVVKFPDIPENLCLEVARAAKFLQI